MTAAAEVFFDAPSCKICLVDKLIVVIGRQPICIADVDMERQFLEKICAQRPDERFGFLVVLEASAGFSMPPDVRDALARMMREYERHLVASAIVYETPGFGASIIRSIASALFLLSRHAFPSSVLASVPAATQWLYDKGLLPISGLDETVSALRS